MVNQLPDVDLRHYISVQNNQLYTPSTRIAEVFGKSHKNVLASIRNLDCSDYFTELNFEPSKFTDTTGRKLPMYNVTKDGFMFLVMGFTGKQAAVIKEAYINAFNSMAEALSTQHSPQQTQALQHLQESNQSLKNELLQLYRDKAALLEKQLQQVPAKTTRAKPVNQYYEHKKHQFIQKVIRYLAANPGAIKTNVLLAAGHKKDDKTARNWLAEFEGIHWDCAVVGTSHAYFCKE